MVGTARKSDLVKRWVPLSVQWVVGKSKTGKDRRPPEHDDWLQGCTPTPRPSTRTMPDWVIAGSGVQVLACPTQSLSPSVLRKEDGSIRYERADVNSPRTPRTLGRFDEEPTLGGTAVHELSKISPLLLSGISDNVLCIRTRQSP